MQLLCMQLLCNCCATVVQRLHHCGATVVQLLFNCCIIVCVTVVVSCEIVAEKKIGELWTINQPPHNVNSKAFDIFESVHLTSAAGVIGTHQAAIFGLDEASASFIEHDHLHALIKYSPNIIDVYGHLLGLPYEDDNRLHYLLRTAIIKKLIATVSYMHTALLIDDHEYKNVETMLESYKCHSRDSATYNVNTTHFCTYASFCVFIFVWSSHSCLCEAWSCD
jgi:hypothetical protein